MSRLAVLLTKRGPARTWNVTVRVSVLGFALVANADALGRPVDTAPAQAE